MAGSAKFAADVPVPPWGPEGSVSGGGLLDGFGVVGGAIEAATAGSVASSGAESCEEGRPDLQASSPSWSEEGCPVSSRPL